MSVNKYNSTSGELELVAGGTLYADTPIGVVQATFDTTAPLGWLLLQGQPISRTEYAELLAWATARNLIGTGKPFGAGDGTTTFVLPDCREATLKGAGLTGKTVGNHISENGLSVGEFIDDRIQEHQHYRYPGRRNGWNNPAGVGTGEFGNFGTDSTAYDNATFIGDSYGARAGATTEVKAIGVNYIIKAKQVGLPADINSAIDSTVEETVRSSIESALDDWVDISSQCVNLSNYTLVCRLLYSASRKEIKGTIFAAGTITNSSYIVRLPKRARIQTDMVCMAVATSSVVGAVLDIMAESTDFKFAESHLDTPVDNFYATIDLLTLD